MDVRMPDGTIVSNVPDGTTQTELLARYGKYQSAQQKEAPTPEYTPPPSTKRTFGEAAADTALSVVGGGAKLLQLPGQIQRLVTGTGAPEEGLEGLGKRSEAIAESMKSEGLKTREAQRGEKIAEAESIGGIEGVLKSFGVAAWETIKDPALLTSLLAEQIPQLAITGGVGKVAQGVSTARMVAAKAAASEIERVGLRVGVNANIATGALMQGTDVGADTYDEAFKFLKGQGKSDEEARDGAINKARGAAAAAAVVSLGAQNLPGARRMEEALLGGKSGTGFIRGALGTGVKEAGSEAVEEGGGAFVKNVAVQQVDPNRSLLQGVGTAAGMGAVGGLGVGAPLGGLAGLGAKAQEATQAQQAQTAAEQEQIEREIETANAPPPPAPVLEVAPPAFEPAPEPVTTATPFAAPAPTEGRTKEEVLSKLIEVGLDPASDTSTLTKLKAEYKKLTGEAAPNTLALAAMAQIKSNAPAVSAVKEAQAQEEENRAAIPGTNQPSTGVPVPSDTAEGGVAPFEVAGVGGVDGTIGSPVGGAQEQPPALTTPIEAAAPAPIEAAPQKSSKDEARENAAKDIGSGVVSPKVETRLRKAFKELTGKVFKPADSMDSREKRIADLTTALNPLLVAPKAQTAMGVITGAASEGRPAALPETIEAAAPDVVPEITPEEIAEVVAEPKVEAVAEVAPEAVAEAEPVSIKDATRQARNILTAAKEPLNTHKNTIETATNEDGTIDLDYLRTNYPPKALLGGAAPKRVIKKSKKGKETEDTKPLNRAGIVSEGEESDLQTRIDKATTDIDPAFDTLTFGDNALDYIIQTGNAFEALVAARIKPFVKNVIIMAIKKGQTIQERLPALNDPSVQGQFDKALGLHLKVTVEGKPNSLVLIHASDNGRASGANVLTILHELFHAATVQKLRVGTYRVAPQSEVTRITKELTDLMAYVKAYYDNSGKNLGLPEHAFDNVFEFVAYGMTDAKLQAFMSGIQGKKTTVLSRFVDAIRQLWSIPIGQKNALLDLIANTDALLGARLTSEEQKYSKYVAAKMVYERTNKMTASADAMAMENTLAKADKIVDMMKKTPKDAGKTLSYISELWSARGNKEEFTDLLGLGMESVPKKFRTVFLGAMTLDQIKQVAARFPNTAFGTKIDTIVDDMRGMIAKRNVMLTEAAEIAKPWAALVRKNPDKAQLLAKVMHFSTINHVDPATEAGRAVSPTLSAMWNSLPPEAQAIYVKARDYYAAQFTTYVKLLEDNISKSSLDAETKQKTIDALKLEFEGKAKLQVPYFPLMREGPYWFKSGSGKNTEYYMFESQMQRDLFLRKYFKDQGDTRPVDTILNEKPEDYSQGNSYRKLYDSFGQSSKLLKQMIDTIDSSKTGDKDALKDSVYQMYLMTMPERSFRKQFVHRKNTPGFSADALRNFAKSSFRMSSQLSRLEYGSKILNTLDEARKVSEGDPVNKPKMDDYVDEVADRVQYGLNPEEQNGLGERAANVANQMSFVWYLTSPASAITNFSALPVFAYPVFVSRFGAGPAKTAAVMGGFAKRVFSMKGVLKTENGKTTFQSPSLRDTLTNADELRAFDDAIRTGAISQTFVADMAGLSTTPSDQYTGATQTAMKAVSQLFHSSEQIMREIAFMSAYRLAKDSGSGHEAAVKRATDAMYEALGDFSSINKARFLRAPIARVMFQFKSFSQMATFYLVNNSFEALKGATPEIKKEAMTRLFGTLGMTGLFAGVTGMPLFSTITAVIELVRNALKDDDEPEINQDLWFRNWLADTFGGKLAGEVIARGPISAFSDINFSDRTKLDNLWFRGVRQSKDEAEWMRNFITDQLGPTVGLLLSTGEASKLFGEGKFERGAEKMLPAVLKNLFVAERFNREGVKTLKGVTVFAEDEISKGDVVWQALGFSPTRVADLTQANIAIKGMEVKIKASQLHLLNEIADDVKHNDSEEIEKTLDKISKFNAQYPMYSIKPETIRSSIKTRMENELMAVRGLQVAKPLRSFLEPMGEYARP